MSSVWIVSLGRARNSKLAQDWYVCWGRYWISGKSSGDAVSELFVFCENMPWYVVAGLLFWGVRFSKRASIGSCMDGGTLFYFSMFWTAEDAFPGVLCRACCPFIHAVNNMSELDAFTYYTESGRLFSFGCYLFG